MKKAALLFALIFALFAGTWTTPCIPGLEYDTPLPAHPAGEWSIFHGTPITYGGTATVWTGPLDKAEAGRYHEIAATAWISGYPGPYYATGQYYTETARIELDWQDPAGTTEWLHFTGTFDPGLGRANGNLTGFYQGATVADPVEAHQYAVWP